MRSVLRMSGLSVAAAGLLSLGVSPAPAQHGHGHVPVHHGTHFGHPTWHHVVPHHAHYTGAYYTVGSTHYYTPAPVVSIVPPAGLGPAAPPPVVAAQRPVEVTFGGFARYEDLAGRMAFEANAMCLDMHYNYRHNKNFAAVYGEAYGVLQAARYMAGKEHNGNREAINTRMVEVDKLFHHVKDEVRGWSRVPAKLIGTSELPVKLENVEAVIHHLAFDVGVKLHEEAAEVAPPPGADEVAPPPVNKN